MPLEIDMENVLAGRKADSFAAMLIRLFLKADPDNFMRLARGFPTIAKLVTHWQATGEVLQGLPYEGQEGAPPGRKSPGGAGGPEP